MFGRFWPTWCVCVGFWPTWCVCVGLTYLVCLCGFDLPGVFVWFWPTWCVSVVLTYLVCLCGFWSTWCVCVGFDLPGVFVWVLTYLVCLCGFGLPGVFLWFWPTWRVYVACGCRRSSLWIPSQSNQYNIQSGCWALWVAPTGQAWMFLCFWWQSPDLGQREHLLEEMKSQVL